MEQLEIGARRPLQRREHKLTPSIPAYNPLDIGVAQAAAPIVEDDWTMTSVEKILFNH